MKKPKNISTHSSKKKKNEKTSTVRIGLIVKSEIPGARALGKEVVAWAKNAGHEIVLEDSSAGIDSGNCKRLPPHELPKMCDVIVSLGGDGTLIGVARYVTRPETVLIGVNFGTLGFLAEFHPNELLAALTMATKRKGNYGERSMLRLSVERKGKIVFTSHALNDVVIHKGTKDRLLEMDVAVDTLPLARVRADGLILSTPTGSTAYSLAAGGSIAHPELPVLLMTPICPHSLTMRPLILSNESTLTIGFPPYSGEIFATVDGQLSFELTDRDRIKISRATNGVRFLRSPSRSYFDILTAKLNWGIPNRAQ